MAAPDGQPIPHNPIEVEAGRAQEATKQAYTIDWPEALAIAQGKRPHLIIDVSEGVDRTPDGVDKVTSFSNRRGT